MILDRLRARAKARPKPSADIVLERDDAEQCVAAAE